MILKISSSNRYLLDVLHKNPNTDSGLYLKTLKRGVIVGNAINENRYEVLFQDTKYSYMPEELNQIDFQSYSSPLAVMHICNSLFAHILKAKEEYKAQKISWLDKILAEIDNEECTIEIPSFFIDSNWYRSDKFLLTKYFGGIEVEQQSNLIFRLSVTAPTVFEAFNLLAITALFVHLTNDYGMPMYLDDGLIHKYGRILTNIDHVPYFVLYLFSVRTIRSPRRFQEFKPLFEEYLLKEGIIADFKPMSNQYQREQFVLDRLDIKLRYWILDVASRHIINE